MAPAAAPETIPETVSPRPQDEDCGCGSLLTVRLRDVPSCRVETRVNAFLSRRDARKQAYARSISIQVYHKR
jgi:hypothetical protein